VVPFTGFISLFLKIEIVAYSNGWPEDESFTTPLITFFVLVSPFDWA
jgi:hypothetical protein